MLLLFEFLQFLDLKKLQEKKKMCRENRTTQTCKAKIKLCVSNLHHVHTTHPSKVIPRQSWQNSIVVINITSSYYKMHPKEIAVQLRVRKIISYCILENVEEVNKTSLL